MTFRPTFPPPFDQVAALYDEVRPGYGDALVDDVVRNCQISASSRLLEIGCGTGQATRSMAPLGAKITALEPGPNLGALATDRLSAFPNVEVVRQTFEAFTAEPGSFDVVYSAMAWHWTDRPRSYARARELLAPNGHLAIWWHYPTDHSHGFQGDVQAAYATHWPEEDRTGGPPPPARERARQWQGELEASGQFEPPHMSSHPWTRTFDAPTYIKLMRTWSDHMRLPDANRLALEAHITRIIERAGGAVEYDYATVLLTARSLDRGGLILEK